MNRTEHHLVAFVIFLSLVTLPSIIVPSQLRVPQQFRTIQSAINASAIGDTVLVNDGRYYENIRISKNITVASHFILYNDTSHISSTIIDGSKPRNILKASVVTIMGKTDTTCTLIGFTICGGTGTYIYNDSLKREEILGGGVYIENAGMRIAHNIITKNTLSTSMIHTNFNVGIPLPNQSSIVKLKNNLSAGAGIEARDSSGGKNVPPYIIIDNNSIIGNISSGNWAAAGGIDIAQPGSIRNNVIIGNQVKSQNRGWGGGIFSETSAKYDVIVEGNYFSRNVAGIGGALLIGTRTARHGRTIVSNNIMTRNEAFEVGGAVNVGEESYAVFINNTIVRNKAMSSGGGINITSGSQVTLVNNILWNNSIDQVSLWGNVQSITNLIEGGLPGWNNIDRNPEFLPNDSLFRLSPKSPCIGTGVNSLRLSDKLFPFPQRDQTGALHAVPAGNAPDIGAVESHFEVSPASEELLQLRKGASDAFVKLTIIIQQISPTEHSSTSQEILQAGRMSTTVIVNDSIRSMYDESSANHSFTLNPGKNLLQVEIVGKSRDSITGLSIYFWLEGSDPQVTILYRRWGSIYHYYSDLRPGTYRLVIQPQDEEHILGHTNRFSFDITVLPYWYQRWWAFALYTFGIIGITFGLFRIRLQRVMLEQKLLAEHIQTEKQTELNAMKSRFLANVSHELRTPLSLILGPIDYLQTKKMDKEIHVQLGIIQRNADRLLRLIELLLQYSRMESGTIKLRVAQEDVVSLLRRCTGYFSSPAAKKQIEIRFIPSQENMTVFIDAEKIEHILQNCLSNAIKFTPLDGTIEVQVWKEDPDVVFSVKDNGSGIAPEHLSHVFERFYRADATHKTEGTGIGLSLSKELAEIHHGSMQIESKLGEGTTVTVRIPLSGYTDSEFSSELRNISIPQEPPPVSSFIDTEESPVDAEELPVILIAEDNEDARTFIRTQLENHYTILEAEDGEDALSKTKFQIPDLVITDVMMPKKDGRELCKELKQDERTSHIPVILLTALAEKEDKIKGLNIGADDYLVKPFDAQELLTRVRNLLENRKKLRETFGRTVPLKPGEISVASLDDLFLNKVLAIITAHITEPEFGVERFAREIFMSRSQLHRKLKAITNLGPSDFIRYIRLQRAKELLEKNAGNVAVIADSVGFTNHSYFAKCFQEQFGLLPNEIRHP
ncbi:MAG: ATP-binding protein [Bacteroidota bacterium]